MMDGNKLEELRELVEFLKANGIAEFDMEHLRLLTDKLSEKADALRAANIERGAA